MNLFSYKPSFRACLDFFGRKHKGIGFAEKSKIQQS